MVRATRKIKLVTGVTMAAGAAAAAAIARAIKASGVLVRLDPVEFLKILGRVPDPLVVAATGGVFTKNYQYLVGYKGLAFYTKSAEPLQLPASAEVIAAKSIWIPG
jgi:hypothetical protein